MVLLLHQVDLVFTIKILDISTGLIVQFGETATGKVFNLPTSFSYCKRLIPSHVGTGAVPVVPSHSYKDNLSQDFILASTNDWAVNYISIGY